MLRAVATTPEKSAQSEFEAGVYAKAQPEEELDGQAEAVASPEGLKGRKPDGEALSDGVQEGSDGSGGSLQISRQAQLLRKLLHEERVLCEKQAQIMGGSGN